MKKKALSLLLAIAMVFVLMPSMAFADDAAVSGEAAAVETAEPADSTQPADAEQTAINERNVTVKVPDLQSLIEAGQIDSVQVDAKMHYGNYAAAPAGFTKTADELKGKGDTFEVEFPYFGKWEVDVTLLKDGAAVSSAQKTVPVIAENYNITVMCATLPVLILTLKSLGEALPAGPLILTVERYWSFDWNNLPGDIFANPFWDGTSFEDNTAKAYANMLYEISPDSHFYFYFNDYWIEREFVNVLWINNPIPEDHYSVRFVTDGSATYSFFRQVYGDEEDAAAKHAEMVEEVKAAKAKTLAEGRGAVDYNHLKYGKLAFYTYAVLDVEKDAEWWVVRKSVNDTFALKDKAFADTFSKDGRVSNNYINNLLNAAVAKEKGDVFRALYKFDDEDFETTRANNKKIMMILGSAKSVEDATPLENYVKLTEAYYGNAYDYYYKGHPGYVPELNPGRKEVLEGLGMKILDSSIAAEIFLFFDPDVQLSGYQSSTFSSASGPQGCLFNTSKEEAYAQSIPYDGMEFFATDMRTKTVADEATLALIKNPDHHNYLLEFNDTTTYDYGVYDADTEELYYIKDGAVVYKDPKVGDEVTVNGSRYRVVSASKRNVRLVEAKDTKIVTVPNTIKIGNKTYKVTSVAAGSFKNPKIRTVKIGANVLQIYSSAFKGSKATKVYVKTKKLTKSKVKGSLKGSKVTTVSVKVGTKSLNKKYAKKYKAYFTKKNAGKSVKIMI